jgi:hypothetical protein
MKKQRLLSIVILAFVLLIPFTSAYYYFPSARDISQRTVYTITDFFEPILTVLFGTYSYVYIFEILLIFLIIASLVYIAVGRIPIFEDQKTVRWVLTIVVPLLGVRWIEYDWLVSVLNSYHLLAIALSCLLPFILYFYFLYSAAENNWIVRKLGWGLFIAVYIGLWSSDYASDLTSMVYFWTFVAGVVCLLFDKKINVTFRIAESKQRNSDFIEMEGIRINKQIDELTAALDRGGVDVKFVKRRIHELENLKRDLLKHKYI